MTHAILVLIKNLVFEAARSQIFALIKIAIFVVAIRECTFLTAANPYILIIALKAVLAEGETIPYLLVCFIAYWQRLDLGLDLQKLFCLLRSSFAHA